MDGYDVAYCSACGAVVDDGLVDTYSRAYMDGLVPAHPSYTDPDFFDRQQRQLDKAGEALITVVTLAAGVGEGVALVKLALNGPKIARGVVSLAKMFASRASAKTALQVALHGAERISATEVRTLSAAAVRTFSNAEAKNVAKTLGFERVKSFPFNAHGQMVFKNGGKYITPDVDAHLVSRGWKMFDRMGKRLGTFTEDLVRVGD